MEARTGLLLVDIGSPDEPTTKAVRRYLREFLSDQLSIDLRPLGRWLLLNLVILPFRPRHSAEAYRRIWTPQGAPLLLNAERLRAALATVLGERVEVATAMRYGRPSIASAFERLVAQGIEKVQVLPLCPQYSLAVTRSIERRVRELCPSSIALTFLPVFFDRPDYLDALAEVSRPAVLGADHLLVSFHGVPERHLRLGDPSGQHCLSRPDCCERLGEQNVRCYRAHCVHVAQELSRRLGFGERTTLSFQSRLTKNWIGPFTDQVLGELGRQGVKRLAVACPSFVCDNLETLEEIALRGKETFVAAGGGELVVAPCLNAHPSWVKAVAAMVREAETGQKRPVSP